MTDIERLRELFDLDAATGVLRWKTKSSERSHVKVGDVAGGSDGKGYLQVQVDRKRLQVHRVVFALVNGFWPEQVDHINGVRSDNRPTNLRSATRSQNAMNALVHADNKSGIKGLYWNKARGKWQAHCRANRRNHYLGQFTDINEAAAAVRAFREAHHREFARHE